MNAKELKERTDTELTKMLREQRETVRDLRFQVLAQQHKNVRDLRKAKRTVAQLLTEIAGRRTKGQQHTSSSDQ